MTIVCSVQFGAHVSPKHHLERHNVRLHPKQSITLQNLRKAHTLLTDTNLVAVTILSGSPTLLPPVVSWLKGGRLSDHLTFPILCFSESLKTGDNVFNIFAEKINVAGLSRILGFAMECFTNCTGMKSLS